MTSELYRDITRNNLPTAAALLVLTITLALSLACGGGGGGVSGVPRYPLLRQDG